jgi:hypothetical protein
MTPVPDGRQAFPTPKENDFVMPWLTTKRRFLRS